MKFDVTIFPDDLNKMGDLARQVEEMGFDGLWTAETGHNPFLPLTHAAAVTEKIEVGTAIAVAFPRSPMVTAQIAWDLAQQSQGRFMLGLGTQIKPHIEKRFSSVWDKPVSQLREYVQSLRAIWKAFQSPEERLRYEGEYYRFTLLTPFFSPEPMPYHDIPVYIAGVNPGLCRLAGEVADGFHAHPLHTIPYLKDTVQHYIQEGAEKVGRSLSDVAISCAVFVVTGSTDEEWERNTREVKSQIAFYASTPSYKRVLASRGWEDFGDAMNRMTKAGQWDEMWREVPDEIMNEIAVVAPPDELLYKVRERYEGIFDRVGYYFPFVPSDETRQAIWQAASNAMS